MSQCGPDNNLLWIEVASDQEGGGPPGWLAPWSNTKTAQQYMIPRGD